jgi:inhibitor of the pro-sigma K processing machinery
MYLEYSVIFTYIIGIAVLFFIGKFLTVPMKVVLKLIYNAVLGGIAILVINFAGRFFYFSIGLNPITAFITGVLGVPGVLMLIALKLIFKV